MSFTIILVLCLINLTLVSTLEKFCLMSYRTFCHMIPCDFGLYESIRTRLSMRSTSHLCQSQGFHQNLKWAQDPGF